MGSIAYFSSGRRALPLKSAQPAGSSSSWPSSIRLGSASPGFAAARQGQADQRPRFVLARLHIVSPLRTVTFARRLLPDGVEAAFAARTGNANSAPAGIWLGLAIQGFAVRSSGQRLPLPRFCCATFQRESPGFTLMVFSDVLGPEGRIRAGRAGRIASMGATEFFDATNFFGVNEFGLAAATGDAALEAFAIGSAGTAGADGCAGSTQMLSGVRCEETFGARGNFPWALRPNVGRTSAKKSGAKVGFASPRISSG